MGAPLLRSAFVHNALMEASYMLRQRAGEKVVGEKGLGSKWEPTAPGERPLPRRAATIDPGPWVDRSCSRSCQLPPQIPQRIWSVRPATKALVKF